MAKSVQVTWNGKAFQKATLKTLRCAMLKSALVVERHAKRLVSIGGGSGSSSPGDPPRVRSGALRRSITHEVRVEPRAIIARVGSNIEYARHLELGSAGPITIRPKSGKYLAIPVSPKTRLKSRDKTPREFPDAVFIESRKGNLLLVRMRDGKIDEVLFWLVRKVQVTIDPRPFLRPALMQSRRQIDIIMQGRE